MQDGGLLLGDYSLQIRVSGNVVTDNSGYGIRMNNAWDTLLDGNTVSGNVDGGVSWI